METNDEMLKQFFGEQKKEIDDFGFTHRVMRKLPSVTDRSWIVWLMAALGMTLTVGLGMATGLIPYIFRILQIIPQLYIAVSVFTTAFLPGIAAIVIHRQQIRWI
jgi:hypothetical protein